MVGLGVDDKVEPGQLCGGPNVGEASKRISGGF